MRIQVLYARNCPHHVPTVRLIQDVLRDLGRDAEIDELEVRSTEDAERLRFPGSPTIRVEGVDIEPGHRARGHYALACRLYGTSGVPPRSMLASALEGWTT